MKRKIGIVIIVLTFILSLNLYLLIFTIPVFLIGLVLIWKTGKGVKGNILWTILPILLWYPVLFSLMYLTGIIRTATAQKFDFIFPRDFKGNVILVGKISCGQSIVIKKGREQLFVPSNGILLYQGQVETGYENFKFYYQIEKDSLILIAGITNNIYFENNNNQPSTKNIRVWLNGSGSKIVLEPPPPIEYEYMNLTVGFKDSLDNYYNFQTAQQFEMQTDSIIRECSRKK